MKVIAIIPARYASTRLPGKPLLEIGGKAMILRVVECATAVNSIHQVIVATDDQRIFEVVTQAGYEAMMTRTDHQTGTDRLAEVAEKLDAEIIVNVQGDEPFIEAATIEAALKPLLLDEKIMMATTCEPIDAVADVMNPNVVKVVRDQENFALYFSRNPIPYLRSEVQTHGSMENALHTKPELLKSFFKHTGLYVYRREFLLEYAKMAPTFLEQAEALEQLRVLENGFRIKVVEVAHRSIGIDTPEDLEKVRSSSQ
jgi:3-deoxy-manno-octulosonate cytidylyltransferase (CMP-KDO synthetase)